MFPSVARALLFTGLGMVGPLATAGESRGPAALPTAAPIIRVADGFAVERVHAVTRDSEGSWISLSADSRGRLYASDQYGPLYRVTLPETPAGKPRVSALALPIGGVHGMSWIDGDLYAVVGQKGVRSPGLYRVRDTNADGELDEVQLLKELGGEGEHGPHAVVPAPDGKSLYVLAGNATPLPELARSRVPRLWQEDALLAPLPALMGSEMRGILPGGWICRTDREGRSWELVSAGYRNAYAMAFDARGELFTFDSDTEFEINLPWYRPTRVLHAVSGSDFGWRGGALKVPENAPDGWPTLLPMGLGSPTAVLAPRDAALPPAYRAALWVVDWSYGKIFALHLQPDGATCQATREEILSGTPLPITALCVNPVDGAIYFTTGGRRLQSALYRLRWTRPLPASRSEMPAAPNAAVVMRRSLEEFHGREDARAVDTAWAGLGSDDGFVRRAARVALESQPVSEWRMRALAERTPRAALAALLALARADARASQPEILSSLRALAAVRGDATLRPEWLRVLSLTLSRGGAVSAEERTRWARLLEPMLPTGEGETDAALLELLVYCESPEAAAKGVAALRQAVTRQAQFEFAKSLRVLQTGWTPALRRTFFEWLAETSSWRGGASFGRFRTRLRDDALATVPEAERDSYRQRLVAAERKQPPADYASLGERKQNRTWTTAGLVQLAANDTGKRDVGRGRQLFGAAGCFACHSFAGEGGALGPDLTGIGRRMALGDLFEAIVEPSREISDQYETVQVRLRDGRELSGRIVNLTERGLQLAQYLADPSDLARFAEDEIASIERSKLSLMPGGLLNPLTADEILDLLAFMRTDDRRE